MRKYGRKRYGHARGTGAGGAGTTFLVGGVLGAGLMYLLDPQKGKTRRALLRDQLTSLTSGAGEQLSKRSRDLRNRARGALGVGAAAR